MIGQDNPHVETVRAAIVFNCDPISEAIGEGCGECLGCEAYSALASLAATLEAATRERDEAIERTRYNLSASGWDEINARADAAERERDDINRAYKVTVEVATEYKRERDAAERALDSARDALRLLLDSVERGDQFNLTDSMIAARSVLKTKGGNSGK